MTPMTTGLVPTLCLDVPDAPRDVTRSYSRDTAFGSPVAQPAPPDPAAGRRSVDDLLADLQAERARVADLVQQRDAWMDSAVAASARHRKARRVAEERAEDAETRLVIAQGIAIKLLRRTALDPGRDDDDTQVIDVPVDTTDRQRATLEAECLIRTALTRRRRAAGSDADPLVALARLVEGLLDAERAIDEHEREGSEPPYPYRLREDRDDAQTALVRAVR